MGTVRLARRAMASRFELVLHGEDEVWLRAAGEAALAEIDRLEAQLSFYRPSSEVSRLNALAASGPVQVEPRLFRLLQQARRLYEETGGAFDVTVAPLMRAWGFVHDTGRLPGADALAEARRVSGMHLVTLDEADRTVAFDRPGVMIDLGGIGKGYAVEEAVYVLQEAGATSAFLHGGTSTLYALGTPPGEEGWKVALPYPGAEEDAPGEEGVLAVVSLKDAALSVSAVWGKAFVAGGKVYGHVLDPRVGHPVAGALLAAVVMASATEADALSTALLVLGRDGAGVIARRRQAMRALVLFPAGPDGRFAVLQEGLAAAPSQRLT